MKTSNDRLREVEFNGHKYKSDGKQVWKDGVLLDVPPINEIKSIEQITALKADDAIFHDNMWYFPKPEEKWCKTGCEKCKYNLACGVSYICPCHKTQAEKRKFADKYEKHNRPLCTECVFDDNSPVSDEWNEISTLLRESLIVKE